MKTNNRTANQARIDVNDLSLSRSIARKNKRKRQKRRKIIFIIVFFVLLLGASSSITLYFLNDKGVIDIEEIVVKGNTYYETDSILKYAEVDKGTGLLSIKKSKIVKNIKRLDYIKTVEVSRRFPHKLVINVSEVAPEYAVYSGGYYIYIDKNLNIIAKSNKSSNLKIIEGFSPKELTIGKEFVTNDDTDFKLALKMYDIIEENKLDIYKISHRNSFIRVFFSENMVCEGTYDNLTKYVTKLNSILDSLKERGIERATIYVGDNDYISFSPRIE